MRTIHVKVNSDLFEEVEELLPFHGGISVAVRVALRHFITDVKNGTLKLNATFKEEGEDNGGEVEKDEAGRPDGAN